MVDAEADGVAEGGAVPWEVADAAALVSTKFTADVVEVDVADLEALAVLVAVFDDVTVRVVVADAELVGEAEDDGEEVPLGDASVEKEALTDGDAAWLGCTSDEFELELLAERDGAPEPVGVADAVRDERAVAVGEPVALVVRDGKADELLDGREVAVAELVGLDVRDGDVVAVGEPLSEQDGDGEGLAEGDADKTNGPPASAATSSAEMARA